VVKLKEWARAIKRDVHAVYLAARDPRVSRRTHPGTSKRPKDFVSSDAFGNHGRHQIVELSNEDQNGEAHVADRTHWP